MNSHGTSSAPRPADPSSGVHGTSGLYAALPRAKGELHADALFLANINK